MNRGVENTSSTATWLMVTLLKINTVLLSPNKCIEHNVLFVTIIIYYFFLEAKK